MGMALYYGRVTKHTFGDLLDKVRKKLVGWKKIFLSFAGRLVLIKSVLMAIPAYAMQTALLPNAVIEEIEKCARNFLWGKTDGEKRIYHLNWDAVTMPKAHGGLGIKRLKVVNRILLAMLGWRAMKQRSAFWATVVKNKYEQPKIKDISHM